MTGHLLAQAIKRYELTLFVQFEVSTTFGQDFTESTSTSVTEGYSVAQGQKGYLSAYNTATLFKGTFTGCDSGNSEQEGEALVLKKGGLAYSVIYTGA